MSSLANPWHSPALQRHVVQQHEDGLDEVMLLVDGLRCNGCVLNLEKALRRLPGLRRVRINAASHRASVQWQRDKHTLSDILNCVEQAGYQPHPLDARALDDRRRQEGRAALKRLLVAGFGAAQAMMFALVLYLGVVDPLDDVTRDLFRWLGFLVATPVVFYSAQPFFAGAIRNLRGGSLGMDVPIALAIVVVYSASLAVAWLGTGEVYFDSVSMFVFFLLCGRYLEMRGRHRALDMTDALARALPATAERYSASGPLEAISVLELNQGERIAVSSGMTVPVDGVLLSEACAVDEAILSGESGPVAKRAGDELLAGSVLIDGPVDVEVLRLGRDTRMAGVLALVEQAQAQRPRLSRLGESIVAHFVSLVLLLAALTAMFWLWRDPSRAFDAVVAVLVVSCPCAFALAVPAAITRVLSLLARQGVLVAQPDAIEQLAKIDHVVFDKTGTLTTRLCIRTVNFFNGGEVLPAKPLAQMSQDEQAVVDLAIELARHSTHPVAQALVASASQQACGPNGISDIEQLTGKGLQGQLRDRHYRLGRASFAWPAWGQQASGHELVFADDQGPLASFQIAESIRPTAAAAIHALQRRGVSVEITSGDQASKVRTLAQQCAVEHWSAALLPEEKLALLKLRRQQGLCVAAVGDGVNDAPVLAGADVSIAMGCGSDLAKASSDIVLATEDLQQIAQARDLATEALQVIASNQRWAIIYNLVVIPIAACGWISPWLAALGMSASSLGVVMNAMRIGRSSAHCPSEISKPMALA